MSKRKQRDGEEEGLDDLLPALPGRITRSVVKQLSGLADPNQEQKKAAADTAADPTPKMRKRKKRKGAPRVRVWLLTKQYGMLMSNLPSPPSLITDKDSIFTAYTDCHTSEPITWCKCNLSLVPPNNVKNLLSCLSVWWKHFLRLNLYVYTLSPSLLTSSNQNYYEIYEIQNLIVTCALDDTQFTGKGMTFFLSFSELSFRSSGSIISACVWCCHNRWKILQGTPYPHWASTHLYRSFQHQQEGTGKN